jgi:hypothetical protein
MPEMPLILGIHLGEMRHVRQEHIHLDHFPDARPGRGQDGGDVVDALARLLRDAAAYQRARRIGGDLA